MRTRTVGDREKVSIIAKSDDGYVIYLSNRKITAKVADYLDNVTLRIGREKKILIEPIELVNRYSSNEGLIVLKVSGDIDDTMIEDAILDYAQEYIEYII